MSKTQEKYFSVFEIALWSLSVFLIAITFFIFDGKNHLAFTASVTGVTSLIFCAKANPIGQMLMIFFSLLYGVISYEFAYYGEMITYVGMTLPMAVVSLISWIKNPFEKGKAEVRVSNIGKSETVFMFLLSLSVTVGFYYILEYFNTQNLIPSSISVTTSFLAVYLTFRRSPYYALAYAANDIVLIILWTMASFENTKYISVTVCFTVFLINDIYGFINWQRMAKRQQNKSRA